MEKEKKVKKNEVSKSNVKDKKVASSKNTGAKKNSTVKKASSKKVVSSKVTPKKDMEVKAEVIAKKDIKKEKKKVNKVKFETTEQVEFRNFLVIILVVCFLVLGLYLFTRAFITKDLFTSDSTEDEVQAGEVNYDITSMGQILNRPYDEYYVAIYDSEGDYYSDMYYMVYNYNAKDEHLHIYTVDLNNYLNSSYYDPDNVNTKAKELEDIKVGDITLLKIKDGKISKYIVDFSKMEKELGVQFLM